MLGKGNKMKTIVDKMPTSAKDCDFAREREDCKKHKYFGCSKSQIVCQLGEKEGWTCPFYTDASTIQTGDEVDSPPVQNQASQIESIWVKYEVNIGGGCATGSVLVPENASDDDIKIAIMDDLYSVDYEKESIKSSKGS
jgi:hypothetical protein